MEKRFLRKDDKVMNFIPVPAALLDSEISSTTLLVYGCLLSRVDELKDVDDLTLKRINDRILAMCTPIYVGGQSKRKEAARAHYSDLKDIFGKEE